MKTNALVKIYVFEDNEASMAINSLRKSLDLYCEFSSGDEHRAQRSVYYVLLSISLGLYT